MRNFGLSIGKSGVIQISPETTATSVKGVFAGGDGAGARAFVADAIASGKLGALAIFCYLDGKDIKKSLRTTRSEMNNLFFQHFIDPEHYPADLKKVVPYERINTLCFPMGQDITILSVYL